MAMRSTIFWMCIRFFSLFSGRLVPQLRSIAWRFRTSSGTTSRVASWVAVSLTLGALPASSASFQRSAQRHQQSPGLTPDTDPLLHSATTRAELPNRADLCPSRCGPAVSALQISLRTSYGLGVVGDRTVTGRAGRGSTSLVNLAEV